MCSEHWLNKDNYDLIQFTRFKCAAIFYRTITTHGGVAIYLQCEVKYKVVNIDKFCIENNIEVVAVNLVDFNIILVSMYRSTSGDANMFLTKLDKLLTFLRVFNLQILICGDFNIDINDNSSTSVEFLNVLRTFNCYCSNFEPTRGKSCLDNAVSNFPKSIISTKVNQF